MVPFFLNPLANRSLVLDLNPCPAGIFVCLLDHSLTHINTAFVPIKGPTYIKPIYIKPIYETLTSSINSTGLYVSVSCGGTPEAASSASHYGISLITRCMEDTYTSCSQHCRLQ